MKLTLVISLVTFIDASVTSSIEAPPSQVTTRNSRIIVYSYPPSKATEPYTYPGPSPPVLPPPQSTEPYTYVGSNPHIHSPSRIPDSYTNPSYLRPTDSFIYPYLPNRVPDAYPMYVPPMYRPILEFKQLPKWCKTMWERDECGMKCWMLRKICRNMHKQLQSERNKAEENKSDSESSPSMVYPYLQGYYRKPQPAITYSKTGLPNTYFAQPTWPYSSPYYRRHPYNYYKYSMLNNELGLNPQFTYVDGSEKLVPPKKTASEDEELFATTTSTTEATTANTEPSRKNDTTTTTPKPSKKKAHLGNIIKGAFPVQVTYAYPTESEVTTLSPLMFDYDQYSNRKYYGDRIYMSTVIPVSSRQMISENFDYDSLLDFDEMLKSN